MLQMQVTCRLFKQAQGHQNLELWDLAASSVSLLLKNFPSTSSACSDVYRFSLHDNHGVIVL